jgi:hypothetical protein
MMARTLKKIITLFVGLNKRVMINGGRRKSLGFYSVQAQKQRLNSPRVVVATPLHMARNSPS